MFSVGELAERYPLHDLQRATPLLVEDTWDRLGLAVDGAPCAPGTPVLRLVDGDGLGLEATIGCPAGATLTVVAGYLQGLAIGHETELEVAGRIVATLDRSSPIARVPWPRPRELEAWVPALVALLVVVAGAAALRRARG